MFRDSQTTIGFFLLKSLWVTTAVIAAFFLFAISLFSLVRGDEFTGQAQDDPKDLLPAPVSQPPPAEGSAFLPLPYWSRGAIMPPLPVQLKPMGTKTAVAVTTPPPSLAPPKETSPAPASAETLVAKTKPAPSAHETDPTLIAVSPFLAWIKANPQAAAAQARQQANGYHAPAATYPGASGVNPATAPSDNPYWLPPLIDSADFSSGAPGGSAAIYSRPQR
jgi:hypothetical protein